MLSDRRLLTRKGEGEHLPKQTEYVKNMEV